MFLAAGVQSSNLLFAIETLDFITFTKEVFSAIYVKPSGMM